jgi:hypothetical protein
MNGCQNLFIFFSTVLFLKTLPLAAEKSKRIQPKSLFLRTKHSGVRDSVKSVREQIIFIAFQRKCKSKFISFVRKPFSIIIITKQSKERDKNK